eukprot:1262486-Rhodomonas_salina.2
MVLHVCYAIAGGHVGYAAIRSVRFTEASRLSPLRASQPLEDKEQPLEDKEQPLEDKEQPLEDKEQPLEDKTEGGEELEEGRTERRRERPREEEEQTKEEEEERFLGAAVERGRGGGPRES